ncbi:MAG: FAD-dependent oxidoreductase [Chloroflexi bacterium]|nr:FAD-dependent oxidoreductase [Chloroflexota bacterium]
MQTRKVDIVVIGAGMAGLSFARTMQQHGREVLILERSRAVGGRCATWRHADLAMDYGVPFLHARSPLFWQTVDELLGADVLSGWPQRVQGNGPTCQPRALDPGVRHAALRGGLNTLAKKLAEGIEILRESEVTNLKTLQGSLQLSGANVSLSTQTLVLAGANAESLRLLQASDFGPSTAGAMALFGLAPTLPTLSLLACYETPPTQPDWELLLPETSASIQLISNESSKNAAGHKLCLCIQARPAWSRQRLNSSAEEWACDLLRETAMLLGDWMMKPDWQRPHRWLESRLDSASRLRGPLLYTLAGCQLGIIGEYFNPAGGLEGAFLSGRHLADLLKETT